MPRATVDTSETKRFDLKSLPDGYVVLRKMSWGEYLHRRDIAATIKGTKDQAAEISMMQAAVSFFEFGTFIVEHNLEDNEGRTLNFKNKAHFDSLHPSIGDELNELISEYGKAEVPEEVKN